MNIVKLLKSWCQLPHQWEQTFYIQVSNLNPQKEQRQTADTILVPSTMHDSVGSSKRDINHTNN